MGSFDGAEVCKLVGLFLLHQLSEIFGKNNVGLYRDEYLAIFRNTPGLEADKKRKVVTQLFQSHALSVTIDTNLVQTDYLDVTFNLSTGKFWLYRKTNDQPLYVNVNSNHPPMTIKQLPSMVEKRISQISCDEKEFDRSIPLYNQAVQQSEYDIELKYQPSNKDDKVKRTRKRNIVRFNPPYKNEVSSNIGKIFFYLLQKHFPPKHRLYKICNRNVIKLSYSCTPNMASSIVPAHNKTLLLNKDDDPARTPCNCRNKIKCSMSERCRHKGIVYEAKVECDGSTKIYNSLCETEFKVRFHNHSQSFKHRSKSKATELSKFIWNCKDEGFEPSITWRTVCHASPYQHGSRHCNRLSCRKVHDPHGRSRYDID